MRIIFMGTPAFSVPSLAELLAAGHEICAVYTQPPRKSGRGHKIHPSPVHNFAQDMGLPVFHPVSFRDEAEKLRFEALEADVAIVVAYGLILPRRILEAPTHGCLNLHGSLLPRWRGAAPIQRAIMAGDAVTGVQVMQMEKGLDTGPVLLSETIPIAPEDTAATLSDRMSHIGAQLLPRALAALERGGLHPQIQREDGVTYADKISSDEARIDWSDTGKRIDCKIRGLSPFPGAWCEVERDGETIRLKLLLSSNLPSTDGNAEATPGTIVAASAEGIDVQAGDGGIVRLLKLQRPGKTPQEPDPFVRGFPLLPGDRLI